MYNFMKLTEREKGVMVWIARHSFVTGKQIERAFGVSRQISYRILRKLKNYGYVKNELVMKNLGLFYATEEGIEVAGVDMNPISKVGNLAEIRHELLIVDLEITLMMQDKKEGVESKWITSREIKRQKYKNAERIESGNVKKGTLVKGVKDELPDSYWIRQGNVAAIEVELTRKSKERIKEKLKVYDAELAAGRIKAVMYYTDKQTIKNLLESQRGVMEHSSRLIIRDYPKVGE
jgi:hypothetical protein